MILMNWHSIFLYNRTKKEVFISFSNGFTTNFEFKGSVDIGADF